MIFLMRHSAAKKVQAIQLRKEGNSFQQIAEEMKIPRGTVREWTNQVALDVQAKQKLFERKNEGRLAGLKSLELIRKQANKKLSERVFDEMKGVELNAITCKILCSLLFWAEGSKQTNLVRFTNSDPEMIRIFLELLRKAFVLDESKFRALIHLHSYHDEEKTKVFWSKITNIPVAQFTKSYQKQNSGKIRKENYMGTLSIRYYNAQIAQELLATYNSLTFLMNRGIG